MATSFCLKFPAFLSTHRMALFLILATLLVAPSAFSQLVLSGGVVPISGTQTLSDALIITKKSTLEGIGSAPALQLNSTTFFNADLIFKGQPITFRGQPILMNGSRVITLLSDGFALHNIIAATKTSSGLTFGGNGGVNIYGANTYEGGTRVLAGATVKVYDGASLGSGKISTDGTLIYQKTQNTEVANTITGKGRVIFFGGGNYLVTGTNTHTGDILISTGTVKMGNAKALGSISSLTIDEGVLDLNGYNLSIPLVGGIRPSGQPKTITSSGTNPVTLFLGGGSFGGSIIDGDNSVVTVVSEGKNPFRNYLLYLSNSNSYSGGTILKSGTLVIDDSHAIGTGMLTIAGVSTLSGSFESRTLASNNEQAWNANFSYAGSGTAGLNLGTGSVMMNATRTVTTTRNQLIVGGVISGSNAKVGLTKAGAGTLILTGNSDYTGVTTITSGTLQLGQSGTSGSVASASIVNNATLVFDRSDAVTNGALISGKGALIKNGNNTLMLSGSNKYTGGTTINSGVLKMGGAAALGATTGNLQVNGRLDLNGFNLTVKNLSGHGLVDSGTGGSVALTTNSTLSSTFSGILADGAGSLKLIKRGTGVLTLDQANTYTGGTDLAGALNFNASQAIGVGPLLISGVSTLGNTSGTNIILSSNPVQNWNANFTFKGPSSLDLGTGNVLMKGTRTVTVSTGTLAVGGDISGDVAKTGLTKTGTGTLRLTGNSSYTGVTSITAGRLELGANGTTGSVASTSIVNNGVLALNRSDAVAYGGVISGRGSVVKDGTGALYLTAINSHSGGTILNSGTLTVGNSRALGRGAVTLNGGVLATDGVVHNIAIGGGLNWSGSAAIHLTLNPDGISDFVSVTGKLRLLGGEPVVFALTGMEILPAGTSYLLMTVSGGFAGISEEDFAYTNLEQDGSFRIEGRNLFFDIPYVTDFSRSTLVITTPSTTLGESLDGGTTGVLALSAVPEPGYVPAILAGIGLIIFLRRRSLVTKA